MGCYFGSTYIIREVIHPDKFGEYIGEEVTARWGKLFHRFRGLSGDILGIGLVKASGLLS